MEPSMGIRREKDPMHGTIEKRMVMHGTHPHSEVVYNDIFLNPLSSTRDAKKGPHLISI